MKRIFLGLWVTFSYFSSHAEEALITRPQFIVELKNISESLNRQALLQSRIDNLGAQQEGLNPNLLLNADDQKLDATSLVEAIDKTQRDLDAEDARLSSQIESLKTRVLASTSTQISPEELDELLINFSFEKDVEIIANDLRLTHLKAQVAQNSSAKEKLQQRREGLEVLLDENQSLVRHATARLLSLVFKNA